MAGNAGMTVGGGRTASGRSSSPLERVTVNLTMRASRALEETVELTGDSKTDSINRALSVYAYVTKVLQDGGSIFVQDKDDTELKQLMIF